jgi:hypothetical protein
MKLMEEAIKSCCFLYSLEGLDGGWHNALGRNVDVRRLEGVKVVRIGEVLDAQ